MVEGRKPVYEVFAVAGDGPESTWTKIGGAWPEDEGQGLDLGIAPGLAVSGRIVLREPVSQDNLKDDGARSVAEADRILDAFRTLIGKTSWSRLRKDELIRAIQALIEAQLIAEVAIGMPGDAEARQRFAAAFLLFAKR